MASIPCSIHAEFSSSSPSVTTWSRPSSPSPPPLPELCSVGSPRRSPFLGPVKTLAWVRTRNSAVMGTRVGGGGGECARCCSELPQHSCIRSQMGLHFTSTSSLRHRQFAKQVKFSGKNLDLIVPPLVLASMMRERASIRWSRPLSATESSGITSEDSPSSSTISKDVTSERTNPDSVNTDRAASGTQLSSTGAQPTMTKADTATPATQEGATKRTPLTAREKLRAARVLSKYTDSRPSRTKSEMGSRVLDAIRETDRGKNRSGLPEAPSNLFDDSKRGMPKQGLTFDFPGGNDMLLIAFSFVFISTVMFATTYVVWKAGAIHFNEY
ncbi:hypothetical protein Taro_049486 [Colocasia esculenta]|uniref:Uncharacterized protein n=1 Tax=Colocasia esculenta TaxID=4460 RepID=A0A843XB36_COLES|nr:hypothetical protein [Colocasia esculenta]